MEIAEQRPETPGPDDPPARHGRRTRQTAAVAPRPAAVRPGMTGGHYQPLSTPDIERIYGTALDVLENIGIGDPIPEVPSATPSLEAARSIQTDGCCFRGASSRRCSASPPAATCDMGWTRPTTSRSAGSASTSAPLARRSRSSTTARRPSGRPDSSTCTTLPAWSIACRTSTATGSRSSRPNTAKTSTSTTSTSPTRRSRARTSRSRSAARPSATWTTWSRCSTSSPVATASF